MNILSTADVPLIALKELASLLPTRWKAEVDEAQMFFKSMEVPSWVSVVAHAPWWAQFLAASASLYVSGLISEAGKDTWKNRGKIAAAARRVPSAVAELANFITSARASGSSKTFVTLGIPFADQYNTASLKLDYASPEVLEFSIALFVHHLPALQALLQSEGLIESPPVGGMQLEFGDDCSMLITWMDRESLHSCQRILPFGNL
jgi:hypothetical protein